MSNRDARSAGTPRKMVRSQRERSRYRALHVLALLGVAVSAGGNGCDRKASSIPETLSQTLLSERLALAEQRLTELDVDAARKILDSIKLRSIDVDQLRARLALAVGDCQGALALLAAQSTSTSSAATSTAAPTLSVTPMPPVKEASGQGAASELPSVANGCARAMAGAEIAVDEVRGVWVRFQNPHDRVLLPLIVGAVERAANAIATHLGTKLPRPIRIELVSDLVSLAKLTGLPLEAAETTGTIAIARWGKVTMVSPRATPDGFPWQDTLAHELAHLVVSRQSNDAAPLWLQEGIAKREETHWRDPMPFDDAEDSHSIAQRALRDGRSVGIEHLGASIALLPTPEAAETAYAEVHDFLNYWVARNGEMALVLLLRDLGGLRADVAPRSNAVDRALLSVSGYSLKQWLMLWQHSLVTEPIGATGVSPKPSKTVRESDSDSIVAHWDLDAARRLRLSELLEERRHYQAVADQLAPLAARPMQPPEVAQRAAFAALELGALDRADELLKAERVHHADGCWLAMRGRVLRAKGVSVEAEAAYSYALAFAPTLEKVACRGLVGSGVPNEAAPDPELAKDPWLSLCRSAREP